MLTDEGDYLAGRKQLNPQVKSYKEYFSTKVLFNYLFKCIVRLRNKIKN